MEVWRENIDRLGQEFVAGDIRLPAATGSQDLADGQFAPLTRLFGPLIVASSADAMDAGEVNRE
jgi:hypothetical protein